MIYRWLRDAVRAEGGSLGLVRWLVMEGQVGLVLIVAVLPVATAVFFVIFDGLLRRLT